MLKRAKKEKYLKICPKCKSIDIVPDKSTLQQMGVLPQNYICKKCGHSGFVFPEVAISELKDFKDEVDKKHLRNTKKDKSELVDTLDGSAYVLHYLFQEKKTTIKIASPKVLLPYPNNLVFSKDLNTRDNSNFP